MSVQYKFLRPKAGSNYRQLFVGRIRAEILYRETVGPEPFTAAQVASEYGVPVEAVLEAIQYCRFNQELLDHERAATSHFTFHRLVCQAALPCGYRSTKKIPCHLQQRRALPQFLQFAPHFRRIVQDALIS